MESERRRQRGNLEQRTLINRPWPRRKVLQVISALGVGSAIFGRALVALAAEKHKITEAMVRQAEWVSGLEFTDEKRTLMLEGVNDTLADYAKLRAVAVDNSVPPALGFHPAPFAPAQSEEGRGTVEMIEAAPARRPSSEEDLAFAPLTELAALVRTRQVSSVELTRLYLERLRRYDPVLRCVITRTEELALKQAERADSEIAARRYRGPLHGIP